MKRLVLILLAAQPVFACINTYHTTLKGKRVLYSNNPAPYSIVNNLELAAQGHGDFWVKESKKLEGAKDFKSRNDYAVSLIYSKQTAKAIPILEGIERERPGLYMTASNLGTAFELSGRNAEALRWIREGIKRNKESHNGSEWVHVAILEAKLAQAQDPNWWKTHSVLAIDFGPDAKPRMPARLPIGNYGKPVTPKEFKDAIFTQMLERRQFVGPPDPYVADLFFDWANMVALTDTVEVAVDLYKEALRFGVPRKAITEKRIAHMKQVIEKGR